MLRSAELEIHRKPIRLSCELFIRRSDSATLRLLEEELLEQEHGNIFRCWPSRKRWKKSEERARVEGFKRSASK